MRVVLSFGVLVLALCFQSRDGHAFAGHSLKLETAGNALAVLPVKQDQLEARLKRIAREHEVALAQNELERRQLLHQQMVQLSQNSSMAIAIKEFKQSELLLKEAQLNLEERRTLLDAAKIDEEIETNLLKGALGEGFDIEKTKTLYAALWDTRGRAATIAIARADARNAYDLFVEQLIRDLVKKEASSKKELIEAKYDLSRSKEASEMAADLAGSTAQAKKEIEELLH